MGLSIAFLGFGVAMLMFAVYQYNELSMLERTGGSKQIHWVFAMIYRATGKWGVVAILAGLSFFSLREAIRTIRTKPIAPAD